MSNMKMQRQQTILTEDGELKEVEATNSRVETLYCIHCGTANRSIASFCRNCGQALDEELDTHTGSGIKSKRSIAREQIATHGTTPTPVMVFNLLKIVIVGTAVTIIATASSADFWSYILAIVFVGAWFMVEAAQAGVFTSGK